MNDDPVTGLDRLAGVLAVLVAATLALTACGGGSSTPQVASLGSTSSTASASSASASSASANSPAGGNSPTASDSPSAGSTGSAGNPTQLLDEWATCMRSHGDTGQSDPVVDANGVIHIYMQPSTQEFGQQAHDSSGPCGSYLLRAANALRGGRPAPAGPSQAQLLKYAECMRANGVPKFPDPTGSTTYVGNLDPAGPVFQNADQLCSKQTGTSSGSEPEPPGSIQVAPANGVPANAPTEIQVGGDG